MTETATASIDHVTGDRTHLALPAHPDALRRDGAAFLTRAFRAFGALGEDNEVARIVRLEHCPGGSTGQKLYLTVEYAKADPALHTELFVKFSRDFTDERRDNPGRYEMQPEVPFAWISRLPGFPIAVPKSYFADYHDASGTGFMVTECIPFGREGIEPHRRKCLDHQTLEDPLSHYRAVVTALARLCAAHKAGTLAPDIAETFPFDPVRGSADPIRYSREKLDAELDYCFAFAARAPQLIPEELRAPEFEAAIRRDAHRIRDREAEIQRYLTGNPDMIALCHWNAHIDNCFFRTGADGALECGFIDWGRVGQITFGSILWGGLSAAHHDIWDHHLDDLLALFVEEYRAHGGPALTAEALAQHLELHMAAMGVARVFAFPEVVTFRLPQCVEASGPKDAMFEPVDPARNSLHIYTNFLKFWRQRDFGAALDRLLADGPLP